MKHARKLPKLVRAYRLGDNSETERLLIKEGAIKLRSDGFYELFSQEVTGERGESARVGDYFKVDLVGDRHYPYPNSREYFESHHEHISGDEYRLITEPVAIWERGDRGSEELDFLVSTGRLRLDENDPEHYFNAELWGSALSAPSDAVLVFYEVERTEGAITGISFNFVRRSYFDENYEYID